MGDGGSGGNSGGVDNMFGDEVGAHSTKAADGTIIDHSASGGKYGYGDIFTGTPAGPSSTKAADGTITTDPGGGTMVNDRFDKAIEDYNSSTNTKNTLGQISKYSEIGGMINPLLGVGMKIAGMFGSMIQPDFDKSWNNSSPYGGMSDGQFTGGGGKNRDARLATGENHINSAVSPTINSMPDQTAEATAKATTTADTELNPEEAAANADTEERAKARQRVGLMQMRRVDPFFLDSLPNIFRSRAY